MSPLTSQFRVCILLFIWRVITSQLHDKSVPFQKLFWMRPTNISGFSPELKNSTGVSFTAQNIPRFVACQTLYLYLVENMLPSAGESTESLFKYLLSLDPPEQQTHSDLRLVDPKASTFTLKRQTCVLRHWWPN